MIVNMPMELVLYPSDVLVGKNLPVSDYTPDVAAQVKEMFEVMGRVDGAGLAAPQVGWNVRLFIIGVPGPNDGESLQRVVWNPSVHPFGERVLMVEGCLSFPRIFAPVPRWTHARLTGKTPEGPIDEIFTGLAAQAVQHEMDHLDGILFIEKMSPADRQRIAPQLRELAAATLSRRKLQ